MNHRVNIQEDIKHYQDTLSHASSKADYSMGENIYMLSGDMNLKIWFGTVGYESHKTNSLGLAHTPAISHKPQATTHIGHSDEKNGKS